MKNTDIAGESPKARQTVTPLIFSKDQYRVYLTSPDGSSIVLSLRNEVNAKFIAMACNAHDELIEQLYAALCFVEDCSGSDIYKPGVVKARVNAIRAAIAKAEGRTL